MHIRLSWITFVLVAAALVAPGAASPAQADSEFISISWEDGPAPVSYGPTTRFYDINNDSNATAPFVGCYSNTRNGVLDLQVSNRSWASDSTPLISPVSGFETYVIQLWAWPDSGVPTDCSWVSGEPTFSTGVAVFYPISLEYSSVLVRARVGEAITPITVTPYGIEVVEYSVTPALPSGLELDQATGTIGGSPLSTSDLTTFVVTGTDQFDQSAVAEVQISVVDESASSPVPPGEESGSLASTGVDSVRLLALSALVVAAGVTLVRRRPIL